MNVSREFLIENLKQVRKTTSDWIRDLEKPTAVSSDGKTVTIYPDGVPTGLSVASVEGIPVEQLRAEMAAMAGILMAIANVE